MTTQQALQKAIEGGYASDRVLMWKLETSAYSIISYPCFLDSSFWQSLGKALEWDFEGWNDPIGEKRPQWLIEWHCFINHLAQGKTVEDFFSGYSL